MRSQRRRTAIAIACWAYLALLLGVYVLLRATGEWWWFGALMLFGPRWVLALPLVALVPAALWVRPRALIVLAVSGVIVLGPLMGLCIPWRRAFAPTGNGAHLRILTCNTHATALKREALANLIASVQPDLVALQEWSGGNNSPAIGEGNWYVLTERELRVESRFPIRRIKQIVSDPWLYGEAIHYQVQTPAGPAEFIQLHLASPHNAIRSAIHLRDAAQSQVEENQALRRAQAADIKRAALACGQSVILAGDFNLPADSEIYRLNLSPFADAFSTGGFGFGWTYHHSGTSTRIDHILSGPAWVCRRCWVADSVGSPHRPLIADLEQVGGSKQ